MSVFDWKNNPSGIHIEDTSVRRHKGGTRGMLSSPLSSSWCQTVAQCDLAGTEIRVYPSIQAAARDLNLCATAISRCVNGKRASVGGFTFKPHAPIGSRR
ncbi:NUMOD1 domain-containing DNA-binding protein [Variovorax sp. ZT5P49]|uniref:NUMOD1 domain-containing DNA-binding protein n=1 Tax=Variovorax sp. ZT5P49 TaxID=3443733 RepID=UPI003F47CCC4